VKNLRLFPLGLLLAALAVLPLPLAAQSTSAQGRPMPIRLYKGKAPLARGNGVRDIPLLYVMLPKKPTTSAAVLVIPGGAYNHVAIGQEGFQIGEWLRAQGMPAFVLDYRVAPEYHYPVEIQDGMRAMRLIRANAQKWGVDPNRIGVWGSSAGGQLASTLGTHCNKRNTSANNPIDRLSCKPDFMVLAYPVISMRSSITNKETRLSLLGPHPSPSLVSDMSNELHVTPTTPPTFLFVTQGDPAVPVQNSLDFYSALTRNHVPAELHVFDYGIHGCGLCGSILPLRVWPSLVRRWFIDRSLLPPNAPKPPAPQPDWPSWPPGFRGPGMPRAKK
jgi:acetyl esterase/lipase